MGNSTPHFWFGEREEQNILSTVLHHEELDEQELLEDEEEELTERFEFVQATLLSSWVEKMTEEYQNPTTNQNYLEF